jgi:DNA-binding HxlR family transcriptional regulator
MKSGKTLRRPDPWSETCPSRDVIGLLASKWVMLLIPLLRRGPQRNGDLMRAMGGVSQKMLTQTLRDLEDHGLVARRDYAEVPPRVDYTLTPLGESLAKTIAALDDWVVRHYYDLAKASAVPSRR